MQLLKSPSSRKFLVLGAGTVGVVLVGFFLLKFMTSGGTEAPPDRTRSSQRSTRRIPKPEQEVPEKSPLFKAMEKLKDPFRAEDPRAAELQDKLKLTQKEIEYLKASLEEKKLRKEIKEIERSLAEGERAGTAGSEPQTPSRQGEKDQAKSQDRVLVKAILISDSRKAALLVCGGRKAWVHEGEQFDGWQIKEIREESVVVWRRGKTFVFFYDRPAIFKEGES